MEGYSPDSPEASKEKSSDKDKKVSKESVGSLLNKSFESASKEDAAGKIKELPIWERLIPKPDRDTADKQAETSELPKRENHPVPTHERSAAHVPPESVRGMQLSELLALAEKIDIEGSSLRTIFEARQITESGLRRIAGEFLRGGDVQKAVRQERMVKEMQFERDPQMRDRLAASYAEVEAARPQTSQQGLADLLGPNQQAPISKSDERPEAQQRPEQSRPSRPSGHQILIAAWIAFVVLLIIIAVVLVLR